MWRFRNRYFFITDLLLLPVAAYLSFVLRLDRFNLTVHWQGFWFFTILVLIVTPIAFQRARIYSRFWRYASVDELLSLTGTVIASTLIAGVLSMALAPFVLEGRYVPRSIPFIFVLLALVATAAPRLIVRLTAGYNRQRKGGPTTSVLIIGAGDAGASLVRDLKHNPRFGLEIVGFIDDEPRKQRMRIYDVPVLGTRADIPDLVAAYNIRQAIIAIPTAPGSVIRDLIQICEQAGIKARIIPGLSELLNGTASVHQLREVNIEDLLRRDPIRTNTDAVEELNKGKRILVTGGGGSIGSELCRQIARFNPAHLILVGHGENSVFDIEGELRRRFPHLSVAVVIADIRDRARLESLYQTYKPEIVFHAAAHKHVPLMESNPTEAITNNVLGTRNLVELAATYNVSHFVFISTDKAVNPTSVMGASKRCAELIVHQVARQTGRAYVAVRFGNVLGSRGSVVPFFKKQIAAGGPVTVTHPDVRRFFMTIPEAVQLVLQAATLGQGGEVFVLDMGEPVRIQDLARDLIHLSGLRPDEDIKIEFSGMRPGEKLFEELFIPGEVYGNTQHAKIFTVHSATNTPVDYSRYRLIETLISAAQRNDDGAIRPLLRRIVPEYQSPEEAAAHPEADHNEIEWEMTTSHNPA